jgi:hypothetical protein
MNTAINEQQLSKTAYVYVRQSTLAQVRHHQESTERQYAYGRLARELARTPPRVHQLGGVPEEPRATGEQPHQWRGNDAERRSTRRSGLTPRAAGVWSLWPLYYRPLYRQWRCLSLLSVHLVKARGTGNQMLLDAEIAAQLNQQGHSSITGKPYTASMIQWIRFRYGIAPAVLKKPEELTVQQVAQLF